MILRTPDDKKFSIQNLESLIFLDPWGFVDGKETSFNLTYNYEQSLYKNVKKIKQAHGKAQLLAI